MPRPTSSTAVLTDLADELGEEAFRFGKANVPGARAHNEDPRSISEAPKHKFGRRVHRLGPGRYLVTLVIDPDPDDRSIVYGPRRDAIRLALDAGVVYETIGGNRKLPAPAVVEPAASANEPPAVERRAPRRAAGR